MEQLAFDFYSDSQYVQIVGREKRIPVKKRSHFIQLDLLREDIGDAHENSSQCVGLICTIVDRGVHDSTQSPC